jgi:hypothetical protein
MTAVGVMPGGRGLRGNCGCVSTSTIASYCGRAASSHGTSFRLLIRTNPSFIPPMSWPLMDKVAFVPGIVSVMSVQTPIALASASGSGCWCAVTRMFFLPASAASSRRARGRPLPRAWRSACTAEPATVSTQDSTKAVIAVIAVTSRRPARGNDSARVMHVQATLCIVTAGVHDKVLLVSR